jgi:hypothetical protein
MSDRDAKSRNGRLIYTAPRKPVMIKRHGRAVAVVPSSENRDELNTPKRSDGERTSRSAWRTLKRASEYR